MLPSFNTRFSIKYWIPSSLIKLNLRPNYVILEFLFSLIPSVIAFTPFSLSLLNPTSKNSKVLFTFNISLKALAPSTSTLFLNKLRVLRVVFSFNANAKCWVPDTPREHWDKSRFYTDLFLEIPRDKVFIPSFIKVFFDRFNEIMLVWGIGLTSI